MLVSAKPVNPGIGGAFLGEAIGPLDFPAGDYVTFRRLPGPGHAGIIDL